MQLDPDPNNPALPAVQMVNYSFGVNVLANDVNSWERLPINTGYSLEPFLSTSCLLIDPAY